MDHWSRWSGRECLGKPLVAPFGGALNVQDPWHVQLCPVVPVVYDQDAIGVDVIREHQFLIGDDPLFADQSSIRAKHQEPPYP